MLSQYNAIAIKGLCLMTTQQNKRLKLDWTYSTTFCAIMIWQLQQEAEKQTGILDTNSYTGYLYGYSSNGKAYDIIII